MAADFLSRRGVLDMAQLLKVHGRTAMLLAMLEPSPTKPLRMVHQKLPLPGHQATRNFPSSLGSVCPLARALAQIILVPEQMLDEPHRRSILSKPRSTPISGVGRFHRRSRSPPSITSTRSTTQSQPPSYTGATRIIIVMLAGNSSRPCQP